MGSAPHLRTDFVSDDLRKAARVSKDAVQTRGFWLSRRFMMEQRAARPPESAA
ncbi:hypothetical protein [Pararhizobium sp. DWP3-4]|uniref:hypothetical protein n=1 Tax=Pararhizobium sp. DWP3-4 TaxID=2804565 RepID=UPI003CFB0E7E